MSRPTTQAFTAIRCTLPSASSSSASCSYLPQTRSFSSSSPSMAVARKIYNKKSPTYIRSTKFLASRKTVVTEPGFPDPILGHINTDPLVIRKHYVPKPLIDLWPNCRLSKVLLHPQSVWDTPMPDFAAGEKPKHFLPGLSENDKEVLFGALPHVSTALKYDPRLAPDQRDEKIKKVMMAQEKQTEMLYRILDLRNADRTAISKVNKRRISDEFGNAAGTSNGSSPMQAAYLTMEIRGLNEHILANPRDIHNKRSLRQKVYARAKHLKYVKRKYPNLYEDLLIDLGLHPRAVEGELTFPV